MKIYLDSNFHLLRSGDLESITFERPEISLKDLLLELSGLSPDSPAFLEHDRTSLMPGWDVEINGRSFALCPGQMEAVLKDGDKVFIRLELLGGG